VEGRGEEREGVGMWYSGEREGAGMGHPLVLALM